MDDPQIQPEPRTSRRSTTERGATSGARGRMPIGVILAIALGIGLVVLMIVLHLTGTIGPGSR